MLEPRQIVSHLNRLGVTFFCGVPDSLLKDFCGYVAEQLGSQNHVITANEGSALALASGHYLATGQTPLVYMQNSGFGNTINPLVSLADPDVYSIPLVLMVGWRGAPGTKDEPQHRRQGQSTEGLCEAIDLPFFVLDNELAAATKTLSDAIEHAKQRRGPVALLVKKNTFETFNLSNEHKVSLELSRERSIEILVEEIGEQGFIVASTGKISRELFEIRERLQKGVGRDFLTVGSMGHASQIALGIAEAKPNETIYCFDGDGAALMHLGGMASVAARAPANYHHIILNNGCHDSVGGQTTAVGFDLNFAELASSLGYTWTKKVEAAKALRDTMAVLRQTEGPTLLDVRVLPGARSDLGRPTRTPQQNKEQFMRLLSD